MPTLADCLKKSKLDTNTARYLKRQAKETGDPVAEVRAYKAVVDENVAILSEAVKQLRESAETHKKAVSDAISSGRAVSAEASDEYGVTPEGWKLVEGRYVPPGFRDTVSDAPKPTTQRQPQGEEIIPTSGESFTFTALHNKEKSPNMGARFGQDKEPAGRYVVAVSDENTAATEMPDKYDRKTVTFENPLVIEFGGGYQEVTNWKQVLSKRYGGLTGKALSDAVRKDGYDGIVTIEPSKGPNRPAHTAEIVDLTRPKKPPKASVAPDKAKVTPEPEVKPSEAVEAETRAERDAKLRERLKTLDYDNLRKLNKDAVIQVGDETISDITGLALEELNRRLDESAQSEKEQVQPFKRGDIVSAFGRDEAKVLIPDLGDSSYKKGNVRIEMTSGANKGKTMDVEPSDIRPLAEEDTIAGKAAKEASDKADAKRVADEKIYNDIRDELLPLVRRIKKSGVTLTPKTKKAKKELLDKVMMGTQNRNEKMIQEAIDIVAAEVEPSLAAKPTVTETPPSEPVQADFMEMSNGVNAPGVKQTIRVTAGERTLLMERSKHSGEWSIKEADKYTVVKGKTPVKTKGETFVSGIVETKKAKEIAQRIIDGTFDKDSDKRFVREDTQNIGLTNAGIAESMKDGLQRRGSFAKLLRENGMATDGRFLMKVNDKDRDAILKSVGETDEGRPLSAVAQMMTDGQKALSRSANAMKPIGYRGGELTTRTVVLQSQDGDAAIIDKTLHDTVLKKYPDAVPYFLEDGKPVSYASNGDVVAIVMPMNMDKPDAKLKELVDGKYDFEAETAEAAKFPSAKPKTKLKAAEKANKELADAVYEFGKAIKGTAFSNIPLTPEVLAAAAKVVSKALEAGVRNFAVLMERMVNKYGEKMAARMEGALQQEWDRQAPQAEAIPETTQPELIPDVTQPKQPAKPDVASEADDTTGTKHAKTDELRAKHGFPERVPPTPETFQEWEDQARRKYPDAAARLRVVELAESQPNRISKIENAAIGQHIVDLNNRLEAGEDVLDELLRTIKASTVAGSEAGRDLVSRKAERYGDFSLAGIVNQHIDSVGEDPTPEQMKEYAELADRIKQLEAEKLDLAKKLAEEAIARKKAEAAAAKPKPPQDKKGTKREMLQKKASEAVAAFKAEWATLSQLGAISDPRQQADKWIKITNAAGKVIKSYVELGVDSFLGLMASVKRDIGTLDKYQVEAFKEAWEENQKDTKVESPLGEDPEQAAIGARAKQLMAAAIEAGYGATPETWMEVVDAVHAQLSIEVPGISEHDTMQAMSDYGVWRPLNKEEVAVKTRAIRGKVRQSLKIEDTVKAIAQSRAWLDSGVSPEEVASRLQEMDLLPKATGREQATPDSIERELLAEFHRLKKELPVSAESIEGQLKTALSTAKTAGRNRLELLEKDIEALQEAIAKREALVKPVDVRTPQRTDPELVEIRKQLETQRKRRDELKAEYETYFPPTKKQRLLNAEQQTQRALDAIEKLKEKLQQLKEGKDTDTKKKPSLVAAEVRAQLEMWRERARAAKQAAKEAELARYEGEGGAALPPLGRKQLTDEQRLARSEEMLQRQIDAVKEDLKALENGTWTPATTSAATTSATKEALKDELDALRDVQKQAREASPAYQARKKAKYWEQYRKSQERRLAFWEKRRDEAEAGNLPVPRKKRTVTENAILDKNLEIEKVQYEAMYAIEKANRATWNAGQWIGHGLLEATSLIPKSLQLGLELSFFNRQGFFYGRSHPIKAFMAAVEAIPAVFSQRLALASMEDIESRPNSKEYPRAEVDFTQVHGLQAKLEEMFQSSLIQWLENTEGKLFLPLRTLAKLYAAFERGNRTFSNIMKADLYDIQKRDTLAAREFFGTSTEWTENDIKQAGRAANIFSGRGTGIRGGNPWMDFLFLARRWAWSRIQADFVVPVQLMTPKKIGQWNADRGMRVAMAKLYIQTLMGHATKMAIGYWVYSLLAGDDEEKKPTIEFDPRSSDAGALKMGETRLKDEGGLMPIIVLAARVATGTMKNSKGEIKSIYGEDVQWGGKTATDFIINYGRSKLGTGPSAILEWASGKDAIGNPVSKTEIVTSRITPMTAGEIVAAEKELGVVQGTLVALEAFFGVGVSTYGPRTEYREATATERQEQMEKELKHSDWDSPVPAYAKFLTEDQLYKFDKMKHYRFGEKLDEATGDPKSESGIKTKEKAIEAIKSSGVTYDQAKQAMIDHWKSPLQDTTFMEKYVAGKVNRLEDYTGKKRAAYDAKGVMDSDLQKKIGRLKKVYESK